MTPQRFDLLKVIREKQPESIKELAAITHRDMKNFSEDVQIFLEIDLIEMERHGKNKAPRLHYDGFRLVNFPYGKEKRPWGPIWGHLALYLRTYSTKTVL